VTWEEIVLHIRAQHGVAAEGARWCGIVFPVELPDGTRVGEKIRVELVTAFDDEPCLLVAAHIGPEGVLVAREALLLNFNMAVAAIGLDGDHFYLRSTLPLATLNPQALDRVLAFVGSEAVRLGKRSAPGSPPVGHFAE
jgi:hypothetical protein